VFLIMGGFPLPGGAVRIDRSALKSRAWEAAVSAAGPASNFVLFMIIAGALHLSGGVENPNDPNQSIWVRLLGVLAVLQIFSVFLNLIPLPPFDGFGIIEPFFDDETRLRIAHSPARWLGLVFIFFVLFQSKSAVQKFYDLMDKVIVAFGLPWDLTWRNFNNAFFGASQ
jgi:Zn-dependent protease